MAYQNVSMPCKSRHIKFKSIQALEFFKFQIKLWKTCSVSKSIVGAQVGSILLLIRLRYPTKGVEMWFSRPQQRRDNLVRQGIWHGGGCSRWRRGWGNLRKPENKIMEKLLKRCEGATPCHGSRTNLKARY